jgi:hypothetical protein
MELNAMQNFWQRGIHYPFWILASRREKSLKGSRCPIGEVNWASLKFIARITTY